jgi:HSP20 family protein
MNAEDSSIENRLKDLRKKQHLSQEELAEELGISRQSVIALEQGKYLPSLPLVINMCKFFHSPLESIFEFEMEIEGEIDNIIDEQKNIINDDRPVRFPAQIIEPVHSGLVGDKENIMPNELGPWRPFREAVSLRDAMDRLFEDSVISSKGTVAMPKIDIKDKKDAIEVRAELPGMEEDEIEIEVADNVMTISGEKKEDAAFAEGEAGAPASEGMRGGYYYKESHSGSFSRSFTLPADVKEEKAEAEMKKGVLIVTIPKIAPKKATKVKVIPKKK